MKSVPDAGWFIIDNDALSAGKCDSGVYKVSRRRWFDIIGVLKNSSEKLIIFGFSINF